MPNDTIYALSSGAGMAGIAVVRVSGPMASEAMRLVAGEVSEPRKFGSRILRVPDSGEAIDRGVVIWCPGPNSATGEDLVEFHVHGSQAVIEVLFLALREIGSVRSAEPGEFSRRAFMNGKMDLVEVEGLADLLAARTRGQWRQAMSQFGGAASAIFEAWRTELVGLLASVETSVDFADEEGVAAAAIAEFDWRRDALLKQMQSSLDQVERAKAIRDGVKVVFAGRPNTGKSSVLNALSRRDAAIVSAIPGTTRDVLEVQIDLDGIPVILTDTAGVRNDSRDEIELLGIERSYREIRDADIVVWVCAPDVHGSEAPEEGMAIDVVVGNKSDLGFRGGEDSLAISAKFGIGLDGLVDRLSALVAARFGNTEQALVVRDRQKVAILESIRCLNDSRTADFQHPELIAAHLRSAANALSRITGRIGVEDWLSDIFNRFCIGK